MSTHSNRLRSVAMAVATLALPAFAYQARPTPPPQPRVMTFAYGPEMGRSYLGVDVDDISTARVAALKLKDEHGVEIVAVDSDGPASKAGFKEHDVVLEYNGQRVEGAEQLRRMIRETPPGRVVDFGVSRDGQLLQIKATLGDRAKMATEYREFVRRMGDGPPMPPGPPDFDMEMPEMDMPEVHIPPIVINMHSSRTGVVVENLTPQLAEFFGVKDGQGILVRSVEKGSPAEKAGLRAGDVITKLNGESIHDRMDYMHAVRARKAATVTVTLVREKKEQTVTMALPEPSKEHGALVIDVPELTALGEQIAPQIANGFAGAMGELGGDMQRLGLELQKKMRESEIQ